MITAAFDRKLLAFVLVALATVALLAAVDASLDLASGATIWHLVSEVVVSALALAAAITVLRRFVQALRLARELREQAAQLAARLEETQAQAARFRAEASDLLAGLGAAIDRQFERWSLSAAEKETALLLLKGLSHKEIASARSITEATARQQARAVYKKAGLGGRNDLAAFFLEDLLLPRHAQARATAT